jgi:putative transposase
LSRSERQDLIEWSKAELPVSTQAELLSVNRSSLYYRPVSPSEEEIQLKHRIDAIYTETPVYGSRKITRQLLLDGFATNRKAVMKHMREMGLMAIYPGPNLSKRAKQASIYPYLLRNIKASYPDHIWGLDITYIRMRHGWMYLVAILDWYSRFIVSWELDQTLQLPFVLEAMNNALSQARPTICNSDQGSHFTSNSYIELLKEHDIQISMDGKGRALDNIFTERLWRTIKYEDIYINDYATPRELREGLSKYIRFYNERRLHQSLDYHCPLEFYNGSKEKTLKSE